MAANDVLKFSGPADDRMHGSTPTTETPGLPKAVLAPVAGRRTPGLPSSVRAASPRGGIDSVDFAVARW